MKSEKKNTAQAPAVQLTNPNLQSPTGSQFPKRRDRPKTVKGYLPVFKQVVQRYVDCIFDVQSPAFAYDTSSKMLATLNYIVDVHQSTVRLLKTEAMWSGWCNLLKQYAELGGYDPVPEEIESLIVVMLGREWECLGLYQCSEPLESDCNMI